MKQSSFDPTMSVLDAETSALDVETSAFGAATSRIARRSFDATISAIDAETSSLGAATSAIAWSYRRYRRGVSGDCGVGITPHMCNRVTNHGDMSTFSKPASRLILFDRLRSLGLEELSVGVTGVILRGGCPGPRQRAILRATAAFVKRTKRFSTYLRY